MPLTAGSSLPATNQRRLLYVDALNYTRSFFKRKGRHTWESPIMSFQRVRLFVEAARQSGWTLAVFIDDHIATQETNSKWVERREVEVWKGKRDVPQAVNRLLGDMFTKLGIKVHYSFAEDNDDTLVSYASADSAAVLSADRDMLRYTGLPVSLKIYVSFRVRKGRLTLEEREAPSRDGPQDSRTKRQVIRPPPATRPKMHCEWGDKEDLSYRRGSPSPLTRSLGNIHLIVRPLRQAVYHRVGVKGTVHEVIPEWDEELGSVKWTDDRVAPDPAMGFLLDGPPAAAIDHFFPNLHENPPGSQQQELMQNHRWAVRAVVYELFVIASGQKLSLLGLMESDPLFKVQMEPPRGGHRGRGYSRRRTQRQERGPEEIENWRTSGWRREAQVTQKEGVDRWKSHRERAQESIERRDGAENKGVETSSRRKRGSEHRGSWYERGKTGEGTQNRNGRGRGK